MEYLRIQQDENSGENGAFVHEKFGFYDGQNVQSKTEWKRSFVKRSKKLARKVLETGNAPTRSVAWANSILKQ